MSSSDKEGDHHGSDIGARHAVQQRGRAVQQQQQGLPLGRLEDGHQGGGAAICKVLHSQWNVSGFPACQLGLQDDL